ncbi:MarR family winged helix-turn-helix transcriptional regulator [Leptothrix sp. BB-4]
MRKQVDHVNHSGKSAAGSATTDVLEAVHGLMHAVRAHQHRAMRDGGHELSPMEGKLLGHLARHPGTAQSELVTHWGRDKGQIARMVNGLKERGLVDALPDEQDRRIQRLHLTDTARVLHEAVHRERRRLAALAVSGLDADERAQLLALLARVRANLDAAG